MRAKYERLADELEKYGYKIVMWGQERTLTVTRTSAAQLWALFSSFDQSLCFN